MRSPPEPNTLLRLLRRNQEEGRRTETNKLKLIHNLTQPIISQKEFDRAIKNARDKFGNAPLDFSFCDLSEITFRPDDETNITTFNKSCYTRAIIGEGPIKDLSSLSFKDANFQFANLSFVNFAEADLLNADLSNANLSNADLSRANLKGANLSGANLIGADLKAADLRLADLKAADLRWADLRWANLRWANLKGANLSGANLFGANLSGADFSKTIEASITGTQFDIRASSLSAILKKLGESEIIKMLGNGSTIEYLKNLPETNNSRVNTNLREVIKVVKYFQTKYPSTIQSTTPSFSPEASIAGVSEISHGVSTMPER